MPRLSLRLGVTISVTRAQQKEFEDDPANALYKAFSERRVRIGGAGCPESYFPPWKENMSLENLEFYTKNFLLISEKDSRHVRRSIVRSIFDALDEFGCTKSDGDFDVTAVADTIMAKIEGGESK